MNKPIMGVGVDPGKDDPDKDDDPVKPKGEVEES